MTKYVDIDPLIRPRRRTTPDPRRKQQTLLSLEWTRGTSDRPASGERQDCGVRFHGDIWQGDSGEETQGGAGGSEDEDEWGTCCECGADNQGLWAEDTGEILLHVGFVPSFMFFRSESSLNCILIFSVR